MVRRPVNFVGGVPTLPQERNLDVEPDPLLSNMTWHPGDVTSTATPPTQPLADVVLTGVCTDATAPRLNISSDRDTSPAWLDATSALVDKTPVFVDTNPLLVDAFLAIVDAISAVVNAILVRGSDVISKLITLQRPLRLGLPEEENRPQPAVDTARPSYPIRNDQALTELKRDEMGCLLRTTFSIALDIALLLNLQTHFDLGLEYLNSHSTMLYLLSLLVKISSAWVNSSPREKSWLSSSFCKSSCSRAQFPTSNGVADWDPDTSSDLFRTSKSIDSVDDLELLPLKSRESSLYAGKHQQVSTVGGGWMTSDIAPGLESDRRPSRIVGISSPPTKLVDASLGPTTCPAETNRTTPSESHNRSLPRANSTDFNLISRVSPDQKSAERHLPSLPSKMASRMRNPRYSWC
ncbi:hypothetical protein PCANC_19644 [Puccinia coronata f. sp. avenae]|uniref:Uncharacterized protein n=1 Tax=Puccinia coronata f. sp. avenae TaxID=200324 RepID=A0A2N5UI47_9BASI|nr:hypothetical protein PCANC_19644 [Puccinia coronata f. sp. avenae]